MLFEVDGYARELLDDEASKDTVTLDVPPREVVRCCIATNLLQSQTRWTRSVTSVSLLSVSSFLFFTHIATTATLGIEQQLCMTASLDTLLLLGTRNIRSCS